MNQVVNKSNEQSTFLMRIAENSACLLITEFISKKKQAYSKNGSSGTSLIIAFAISINLLFRWKCYAFCFMVSSFLHLDSSGPKAIFSPCGLIQFLGLFKFYSKKRNNHQLGDSIIGPDDSALL